MNIINDRRIMSKADQCKYVNPDTQAKCCNKKGIYPHYCWRHTDMLANVMVKKSGVKGAGMGLYAGSKGYKKGEPIIQYGIPSIKISAKELGAKCENAKDYAKCWGDYTFCNRGKCWDARKPNTTVARYANDCHNSNFKCNAEFHMIKGIPWMVSTRKIEPKSEVFCSYGSEYWSAKE